jgi:chromosome segregation ATPase
MCQVEMESYPIIHAGPSMTSPTTIDRFQRTHAALLADLAELKNSLEKSSGTSLLQVCTDLVVTRLHVTNQFRLEEQDGWVGAVRRQEPRWQHAIETLVEEHRKLESSLETLMDEANAAEMLTDSLRAKILTWLERVHDHESRENDLVEEAFTEDLGAGD